MNDDMQVDSNLVIDALRAQVADLAYRLAIAEALVAQHLKQGKADES